jgi:hypothetical protein
VLDSPAALPTLSKPPQPVNSEIIPIIRRFGAIILDVLVGNLNFEIMALNLVRVLWPG